MAIGREETFGQGGKHFSRRAILKGGAVIGGAALISAVGFEANKALNKDKGVVGGNTAVEPVQAVEPAAVPVESPVAVPKVDSTPKPILEELPDPGVSEASKALITSEVDTSLDFYRNFFGKYPQSDISLITFDSTTNAKKAGMEGLANSGRQAGRGFIMVDTTHPSWLQNPEFQNRKIIAHETFHQYQLDYFKRLAVDKPWIDEGAAEYAGYAAIVDQGLLSARDAKDRNVSFARSGMNSLGPLGSLGKNDQGPKYALYYLAVDRLVGQSGGIQKLAQYYRNLQGGAVQAEAFKNIFGVTFEEFEADFEKYRKTI